MPPRSISSLSRAGGLELTVQHAVRDAESAEKPS